MHAFGSKQGDEVVQPAQPVGSKNGKLNDRIGPPPSCNFSRHSEFPKLSQVFLAVEAPGYAPVGSTPISSTDGSARSTLIGPLLGFDFFHPLSVADGAAGIKNDFLSGSEALDDLRFRSARAARFDRTQVSMAVGNDKGRPIVTAAEE